jgi:hypothetical protein
VLLARKMHGPATFMQVAVMPGLRDRAPTALVAPSELPSESRRRSTAILHDMDRKSPTLFSRDGADLASYDTACGWSQQARNLAWTNLLGLIDHIRVADEDEGEGLLPLTLKECA